MYHVGASLRLAAWPDVFYAVCDEWRSGVAGPGLAPAVLQIWNRWERSHKFVANP